MEYETQIIKFLRQNNDKKLLTNGLEKDLFITLSEIICGIVHDNTSGYGDVDYNGVIDDVYNKVIVQVERPILEEHERLFQEYSKLRQHEKISAFTTKDMEDIKEQYKDKFLIKM